MKQSHGLSGHRLYTIFANMKQRCYNPNANEYSSYGGRNITVCNEWLEDFKSFYDWAIANGYNENLTIDRIDNDKGYYPDNCRWVTQTENLTNRKISEKQKMGRPTENPKTNVARLRLTDDEREMLNECCRATGYSISAVLKMGLEMVYKTINKE